MQKEAQPSIECIYIYLANLEIYMASLTFQKPDISV